ARAEMPDPPTLRLASLLHLRHPMSVDLHLDACATKSRLVVARILGGRGYWTYGLEQYAARLHEAGVPFAALPGDDKPDAELRDLSTVAPADYDALWSALVEGGPANAATFLVHANAMLDDTPRPAPPRPLLRAGLYWPGTDAPDLATVKSNWTDGAPIVPILFYRALLQGAGLNPINRLTRALLREGLNPLPIFVASLKDPVSAATLHALFAEAPPDAILNLTSFAVGDADANPLTAPEANHAPVFQAVLAASTGSQWREGLTGLTARDIAMNVALPELDGRVLTRAVGFKGEAFFDAATQCPIATWKADGERIAFVAQLLVNQCRLRRTPAWDKRVALILANYPNRDGRLANGVGLDTPAATVHVLHLLAQAGHQVTDATTDSATLMARLMAGPTNWLTDRVERQGGERLSLADYNAFFATLPLKARQQIADRWGPPEADPFFLSEISPPEAPTDAPSGAFVLALHRFGNTIVGLQPARGYNVDPTDSYHSPDLVPPHHYLAFYAWLRRWGAHAIVHMGKHGNLEWLPGRSTALGPDDWPEIALGPVPHLYPFIVNDPGEGTQGKRRAQAVIIDHLTPPLTRAETYGPLRDLEALVDEYYDAANVDPRRVDHLRDEILSLARTTGLDVDAGMTGEDDLAKLDAYLCELKEAQIRDGLHIFGQSPGGDLERDLAIALMRLPRGEKPGEESLIRALAQDCGVTIDPLDCDMAAPYDGPRHKFLHSMGLQTWRSNGDTVERLEKLAQMAVAWSETPQHFTATAPVLESLHGEILPALRACGPAEGEGLLTGLKGHFVAPAPSGAPTRGRPDVLPTGRNFYSIDSRAVPTPTAWKLGWKSANLLIERHLQDHGDWPRTMLLTAWGTANMRTGGDDIAQGLALMGVKPKWDSANRRVTGFEIIPHTALGRPRVDVTLRVSGFFRDAFPQQMALFDAAARAVQALEEPEDANPAAARARAGEGQARVYGSKPGAYGAGLQALIDERIWADKADLGNAYLEWGGYAYGTGEGTPDHAGLRQRLSQTEAIVQN
ncbi:MAG: cobaltochelatase subunit CobN, partial [Pseudomonadota bacterium]